MFIRFVVAKIHRDSHRPQGVFIAAYNLLESGDLDNEQYNQLRELIKWFEETLPVPDHPYVKGRAIFWYRSSAVKFVRKTWELINLLQSYGIAVEIQTCRHFDNAIYRDAYQVAAYPSPYDAPVITRQA